jgi:hypothetical protein
MIPEYPHPPVAQLDVKCPSNFMHAKQPLSAIYREARTQATHVGGMRHGATSNGGLRSRNSDMEPNFKHIT